MRGTRGEKRGKKKEGKEEPTLYKFLSSVFPFYPFVISLFFPSLYFPNRTTEQKQEPKKNKSINK